MANLFQEVQVIKQLSKNIVNNYIEIGNKLKEIKDREIFLVDYPTFSEFIEGERAKGNFTFTKSFVIRLLKVIEDPILLDSVPNLGISKTMELLYVNNKEAREEIIEKAESGEKVTQMDIRDKARLSKHIEGMSSLNDNVIDIDKKELKTLRQGKELLNDVISMQKRNYMDLKNLSIAIQKWLYYADNCTDNQEIQMIKNSIEAEFDTLKRNVRVE